jgi:exonuclease SbcC
VRPIKLTIEGFTSFAERAEIDFSDLDLFAIIGPTGSGKTSLLDAMTWALYGKTSRLGKTATELISHGVNKVTVHLEFAVGNDRYQVARTAKRSGSPQIRLEKYAGAWIPVEAEGAAEINDAVCRIVGLDFDAFTRSVILPQGKFDAFLRGEHKERREILKALLGLEVYDRMRELAGSKRDQLKAQEEAHQGVIERDYASANVENLKALRADLWQRRKAQKENAGEAKQVEELLGCANELRRSRESLAQQQSARTEVQRQHLRASSIVSEESGKVDSVRKAIQRAEDEIAAVLVDDARYAHLVTLNERAGTLAQVERSEANLLGTLEDAQAQLRLAREQSAGAGEKSKRAEARRTEADNACALAREGLSKKLARGSADLLESLIETLRELPSKRQALAALETQKGQLHGERESLFAELKSGESNRATAQETLDEAKEHYEHLSVQNTHRELRAGLKKGEPCPVCEQTVRVLPKIPAASALDEAKVRVKAAENELRKIQNALVKTEGQIESLPGRLTEIEKRTVEATAAIDRVTKKVHAIVGEMSDADCLDALIRAVSDIRGAEKEVRACEGALKESDREARRSGDEASRLDKDVTALSVRVAGYEQELHRLKNQIEVIRPEVQSAGGAERITADLKTLNDTKQKRDTLLANLKKLSADLERAQQSKSGAEKDAAVLSERLRGLDAEIARLNASIANLSVSWLRLQEGLALPAGADEADRTDKKRRALEGDRVRITGEVLRLESAIEDMTLKIAQLANLKKRVEELHVERYLYEQLATALRADRFIAYLLESAYADLCTKGSEHLMRVSQERYTFAAGKNEFYVKDGWNADAERSARTLSGGESFLASLALALALADSVASFGADGGQGAQIDALFLDEGVSSLDQDDTLPAVIDALSALQSGDRMVCVISHMENLAERLPARIEIVKDHGRSSLKAQGTAISEVV